MFHAHVIVREGNCSFHVDEGREWTLGRQVDSIHVKVNAKLKQKEAHCKEFRQGANQVAVAFCGDHATQRLGRSFVNPLGPEQRRAQIRRPSFSPGEVKKWDARCGVRNMTEYDGT